MQTKSTPSKSRVEFTVPPGFAVPERDDPSKPFDVVCSFMPSPDGKKLCLVEIGNTDMPGYDDGDEETAKPEVKPDYSQMAQGMMSQQPAGAGQGY
jgi:hypothetical protein